MQSWLQSTWFIPAHCFGLTSAVAPRTNLWPQPRSRQIAISRQGFTDSRQEQPAAPAIGSEVPPSAQLGLGPKPVSINVTRGLPPWPKFESDVTREPSLDIAARGAAQ